MSRVVKYQGDARRAFPYAVLYSPTRSQSLRIFHRVITSVILSFCFFLHWQQADAQFQNCAANANVDQSICQTQAFQLAGGAASQVVGYTPPVKWIQIGGPSVLISNPALLNPTIAGYQPNQTYTFRLQATCQDGSLATDDVKVTVKPITIANAGRDTTLCPGTYTLKGNALGANETVTWQVIGSNGAGVSILAGGNQVNNSITISATSAGSSVIRYTITNTNGCTTFDDVVITNRGGVTNVNAGADITLGSCYSTSQCTNLSGTFAGNGTGGQSSLWTLVSGPTPVTISSPTANGTQVCGLSQGTYTFRYTVTGPCATGTDDVIVNVGPPSQSVTSANAGSNQTSCDGRTTAVLQAIPPTYAGETVAWTKISVHIVRMILPMTAQRVTLLTLTTSMIVDLLILLLITFLKLRF